MNNDDDDYLTGGGGCIGDNQNGDDEDDEEQMTPFIDDDELPEDDKDTDDDEMDGQVRVPVGSTLSGGGGGGVSRPQQQQHNPVDGNDENFLEVPDNACENYDLENDDCDETTSSKRVAFRETAKTGTSTDTTSTASSVKSGRDLYIMGTGRRTKAVMTKFEYARVIGVRATEIENGAADIDQLVINFCINKKIDKALDIARIELEMVNVHFPMKIYRRISVNIYEVWKVRELKLQSQVLCTSFSDDASATLNLGGAAVFPYNIDRCYARGTSSLAYTGVVV